jgi:hypothetical protein
MLLTLRQEPGPTLPAVLGAFAVGPQGSVQPGDQFLVSIFGRADEHSVDAFELSIFWLADHLTLDSALSADIFLCVSTSIVAPVMKQHALCDVDWGYAMIRVAV